VRDWPELEVAVLQRGSDAPVSRRPRECRVRGKAAPGTQTRTGERGFLNGGVGVAAAASRPRGACLPLGRRRTQVSGGRGRVRVGPQLELAIGAAGEAA
jgi:hypothetical protein